MLRYATSALPKSKIQRLRTRNEGSSGIAEDSRDWFLCVRFGNECDQSNTGECVCHDVNFTEA